MIANTIVAWDILAKTFVAGIGLGAIIVSIAWIIETKSTERGRKP